MPKKFKLTKKQMYIGGAVVAAGLAYWYWQSRKAKAVQVAAASATPPNQYTAAANALLNLIPSGGVLNQPSVITNPSSQFVDLPLGGKIPVSLLTKPF